MLLACVAKILWPVVKRVKEVCDISLVVKIEDLYKTLVAFVDSIGPKMFIHSHLLLNIVIKIKDDKTL